jgi:hypothetical protein
LFNAIIDRIEYKFIYGKDYKYITRTKKSQKRVNSLETATSSNLTPHIGLQYNINLKMLYIKSLTMFLIVVLFVYVIPALIFTYVTEKNWSFLDSLYYCFISITTIGFGNLIFLILSD